MIIILISALIIRISLKSLLWYNNKADAVNNILTVVIVWVPIVVWKQEGNKHVHLLTEGILFICMVVSTYVMSDTED